MIDLSTLTSKLQAAIETLSEFQARLPGAEAALAAATEHRRSLLAQTVRGAEIAPKVLKNAGLDIAAAEDSVEIIRAQIAEAEAGVKRAQVDYDAAKLALAIENVGIVQRGIIAAADKMMRASADYAAAVAEYETAYAAILPAMQEAGITPQLHVIRAVQKAKATTSAAIPESIQQAIIQRGSVFAMDLSRDARSLWLDGAAPDPEADEPFDRAAREEAERIGRQQAFEDAGRKEKEARRYNEPPDWTPTELQTGQARGTVLIGGYELRPLSTGR